MAFVSVKADFSGMQAMLEGFDARSKDMSEVFLQSIDPFVERSLAKQFLTRGAYFGTPWPPLAASTLKAHARLGLGDTPLLVSGALLAGWIGDRSVVIVTPTTYERTNPVISAKGFPYPIVHQTGTSDGRVPARPITPSPSVGWFRATIQRMLNRWIARAEITPPGGDK